MSMHQFSFLRVRSERAARDGGFGIKISGAVASTIFTWFLSNSYLVAFVRTDRVSCFGASVSVGALLYWHHGGVTFSQAVLVEECCIALSLRRFGPPIWRLTLTPHIHTYTGQETTSFWFGAENKSQLSVSARNRKLHLLVSRWKRQLTFLQKKMGREMVFPPLKTFALKKQYFESWTYRRSVSPTEVHS